MNYGHQIWLSLPLSESSMTGASLAGPVTVRISSMPKDGKGRMSDDNNATSKFALILKVTTVNVIEMEYHFSAPQKHSSPLTRGVGEGPFTVGLTVSTERAHYVDRLRWMKRAATGFAIFCMRCHMVSHEIFDALFSPRQILISQIKRPYPYGVLRHRLHRSLDHACPIHRAGVSRRRPS